MSVLEEIAAERKRQIESEGWTHEHDNQHRSGELARAAACYAYIAGPEFERSELAKLWWGLNWSPIRKIWPGDWDWRWFKPTDRRRDLIKAAALIVAEIERLDRGNPNKVSDA